jgi:anaerobic ribonucleoside-triphosphate reductase activating protein
MAYSGWTFEELQRKPECAQLLGEIDALVDGRFILARKSLDLRFRGSSNQRLIHLDHGKIVAIE